MIQSQFRRNTGGTLLKADHGSLIHASIAAPTKTKIPKSPTVYIDNIPDFKQEDPGFINNRLGIQKE